MNALFKKLNFKNHRTILSLNHPQSFQDHLSEMSEEAMIVTNVEEVDKIDFALVFVTKQAEIDDSISKIAPKLEDDPVLWYCYPKGSSKKYKSEINRDKGWSSLAQHQLEPVRQVAIDEDWSALRFRKVQHIKSITRRESFAMTEEAKKRTTKKGE